MIHFGRSLTSLASAVNHGQARPITVSHSVIAGVGAASPSAGQMLPCVPISTGSCLTSSEKGFVSLAWVLLNKESIRALESSSGKESRTNTQNARGVRKRAWSRKPENHRR